MKNLRNRPVNIFVIGVLLPFASSLGQNAMGSANTGSVPLHSPSDIPAEYTITPFGYFHRSCIQKLAKGERLLSDGHVQHANGKVEESVATCSYPHYTSSGMLATAGAATLPDVNGWIENANVATGSANKSYGALVATWTVPPQPTADHGQVLFYFPGLEDANDPQTSILQPVLQWYGGQWSIASWNCCLNGITTESPVVNVHSGDAIYGSITSTCPAGTLTCPTWNVLSLDLTTGQSTTLSNTPSEGQVFNWAFGGVLEPYNVISCDDYPANRAIVFNDVTVFDQYLQPITKPDWTETSNTTQTPQCGYAVKANPHKVKLDY